MTKIKIESFLELCDLAIQNLRREREYYDNDPAYEQLYNFELEITEESWIEFTKQCLKGGKYE